MSLAMREDMNQEDLLSIQRQLAEARKNLRLIKERQAEFVLGTEIPPAKHGN